VNKQEFEFRSRLVDAGPAGDGVEKTCNEWAAEGWEVFSVVVPQSSNYSRYRLTARRSLVPDHGMRSKVGRRFRSE
jgi:hypothetical protein